jgi:hypothetical protein
MRPKVQLLVDAGLKSGWTCVVSDLGDNVDEVRCERDGEVILAWFRNGNQDISRHPSVQWTYGDRVLIFKNMSAARRQMSGDRPIAKREVSSARKAALAEGQAKPKVQSFTWPVNIDPVESTPQQIIDWLLGRTISWRNGQLRKIQSDTLLAPYYCASCFRPVKEGADCPKHPGAKVLRPKNITLKPYERDGRVTRVLTFPSTSGGFVSVALDRIVSVK